MRKLLVPALPISAGTVSPLQLPLSPELLAQTSQAERAVSVLASVLDRKAKYVVNRKALARWSTDRLALTETNAGNIEALFRYEGTTCSNMGRRLSFDYRVTLGPRSDGYPIQDECCGPAADDEGHRSMCEFLDDPRELQRALDRDKPLLGARSTIS